MSTVATVAVACSAVAALITALKVVTGWGPVRWLWGRLVHAPVREALQNVVREEVTPLLGEIRMELSYNGGGSTKDAVRRIEQRLITLEQNAEGDRLRRDGRA